MSLALFLDFDGVLNSWQSIHKFYRDNVTGKLTGKEAYESFCPIAISNLNCLVEEYPEIDIVISSTWRLGRTVEELRAILKKNGFLYSDSVIDKTKSIYKGGHEQPRGTEVDEWLIRHPDVKEFVILDDDNDMEPHMSHWIGTDQRLGFDFVALEKVFDYFEKGGYKRTGKIGVCAL